MTGIKQKFERAELSDERSVRDDQRHADWRERMRADQHFRVLLNAAASKPKQKEGMVTLESALAEKIADICPNTGQ